MERTEVVIVGGGAVGTAAARALAGRGRAVTLLERGPIGHADGSSGGPTRIFRLAYDLPDYVRMARVALRAWRDLEAEAGEELLVTTGGIDIGSGARLAADALAACGEPFAWLDADATAERWPALRLAAGERALVQEDAGVCLAERTVHAQARLARARGVDVRETTAALAIAPAGDGVEVRTADATIRADVAVVAAGAWAGPLLRTVDIDVPLTPTLEQVTYLRLTTPSPLPTVIDWADDGSAAPYAVPDPTDPGAFKIALHGAGPTVDPDRDPRDADPIRRARAVDHAARRFAPHAVGGTDTCLYTRTPDEDFVLDRVGPIVVASPCSGHGFKFTPLLGDLVADLATDATPAVPLERFRLGRPALRR
ncbi:MAG: N-methyl-L-tryptophan oxidase [Actinomycetota bacterium]